MHRFTWNSHFVNNNILYSMILFEKSTLNFVKKKNPLLITQYQCFFFYIQDNYMPIRNKPFHDNIILFNIIFVATEITLNVVVSNASMYHNCLYTAPSMQVVF